MLNRCVAELVMVVLCVVLHYLWAVVH